MNRINMTEPTSKSFSNTKRFNFEQPLDVLVIGGGITGAGALREANRLGYQVALFEMQDFAWGTSSRSSKLVHGGLRYLEQGNILLTYHALTEREWLLDELPGLVEDLPFLFPIYKHSKPGYLLLKLGLSLYDLLARRWSHSYQNSNALQAQIPGLKAENLNGGFEYPDAVTDDTRLTLRVIQEAVAHGAKAYNYAKVVAATRDAEGLWDVTVEDQVNNTQSQIKTRAIINASGIWINNIGKEHNSQVDYPKLRPLRGSHLIVSHETLPINKAMAIQHPEDKRLTFIWPWEGSTIIGTTDLDHEQDLNLEPAMTAEELDYLLELTNHYFPNLNLKASDVISTFSGVRPIIDTGKANPSDESRDAHILDDDGLLTVTGGKLTTFRSMAADAVKAARKYLPKASRDEAYFSRSKSKSGQSHSCSDEVYAKLVARYGADVTHRMLGNASAEEQQTLGGTLTTLAEIKWNLEQESVIHLDDLLLRRVRIGLLVPNGAIVFLEQIKPYCQSILGWNEDKWQAEVVRYQNLWQECYGIPEA